MLVSVVEQLIAVTCTPFSVRSAATVICRPDLSNHDSTRWPEVTAVGLDEK